MGEKANWQMGTCEIRVKIETTVGIHASAVILSLAEVNKDSF